MDEKGGGDEGEEREVAAANEDGGGCQEGEDGTHGESEPPGKWGHVRGGGGGEEGASEQQPRTSDASMRDAAHCPASKVEFGLSLFGLTHCARTLTALYRTPSMSTWG